MNKYNYLKEQNIQEINYINHKMSNNIQMEKIIPDNFEINNDHTIIEYNKIEDEKLKKRKRKRRRKKRKK